MKKNETLKLIVITGGVGAGKTTFTGKIVSHLQSAGITIAGFLARGNETAGEPRSGYFLTDIASGDGYLLCSSNVAPVQVSTGKYYFFPGVIDWGINLLENGLKNGAEVMVMDEIGPLELIRHQGWRPALDSIVSIYRGTLILVIRESLLGEFAGQFTITPALILNPSIQDIDASCREVIKIINLTRP